MVDDPQQGEITVAVDESFQSVTEALTQRYMALNPKTKINLVIKKEDLAFLDLLENKVRVIVMSRDLSDEEKKIATQLVVDAGADYVKTSTGFGNGGANITDIQLMKAITQDKIKIKASGGIRDYETAIQYIENGVMRIGTSNGIQIVTNNSDSNSTTY